MSSSNSSAPLIKGYLPVRLRFPASTKTGGGSSSKEEEEEHDGGLEQTFVYVREHRGKQQNEREGDTTAIKPGTTLFVANAPVIPGVSTKLLLKSIFGRFAAVQRVTVVQNPRGHSDQTAAFETVPNHDNAAVFDWTADEEGDNIARSDRMFHPTFLPSIFSEGKYAHVVFETPKEMKKAKKALEDIMKPPNATPSKKKTKSTSRGGNNAILLDGIEIQTLSDESLRLWEERRQNILKESVQEFDLNDDFDSGDLAHDSKRHAILARGGVLAVAQRYRDSLQTLSRSRLLEECNKVMTAYEAAEEAKRRAQDAAKSQPDDDGFVTVSYSTAVGSKADLEESMIATTPSRRKGNKRSRKKKEAIGSQELKDFYRFQRRENRKRSMDDLRKQFEEDLKRVKRLKEEKQYRPF
jgi:ribosomal RNA-processing protein 7